MNVSVLVFPGTNCELDTKYAYEKLGAKVDLVWHKEESLPGNCDLVVLPGGFSYGDYLRSGAIAKFSPITSAIKEHAKKGGYILGICNGFQILLELGLLPGAMKRNENLHFISKYHYLKVIDNQNRFLRYLDQEQLINIPIAHADGNYYADNKTLENMYNNEQVILKYCDKNGELLNTNGSVDNIAGVCNHAKNVFGLMPHPERAVETLLGCEDGIKMLEGFIS
jgi:phosphoribosylformylglycinamidine synthase